MYTSTTSDEEWKYWVCRECSAEGKYYKNDFIYPTGWTCTDKHGLICEKCSKKYKVKPDTSWDELQR